MARVAVVHNTLDFQGGADAVCLSTCAALQRDHSVTLYTISETDPGALARRFDIDLDIGALNVASPTGSTAVSRALGIAAPTIGPQLPLRSVLIRRTFERDADEFDLVVSTANEFAFSIPSVQYVHFPQFNLARAAVTDGGRLNPMWSHLAGPDRDDLADTVPLTNSSWTADVFERIYGIEPDVVYPPVDPIDDRVPWQDREDGIVVVGRLAPDKRVIDAIRIVDALRGRGCDVHLHLVGAAPRSYRQYVDALAAEAAGRSYVTLERDVDRDRLEGLLRTHKYGLNLKPNEHFGMSVAEYVAAGMLAFAPNSGGQREILDGRAEQVFDTTAEAVEVINHAIERDDSPVQSPDRFERRRFDRAIRSYVKGTLH